MIVGGFLEFIIGNTFPFVVFMSFGAFWLGFAATLQPFYNAYGAYATTAGEPATGLATTGFQSSFAFFLVFMGLLCLIYLVCALRTNIVFVVIFLSLVLAFSCLAGAYWYGANGDLHSAQRLTVVSIFSTHFNLPLVPWSQPANELQLRLAAPALSSLVWRVGGSSSLSCLLLSTSPSRSPSVT